MASEGRSRWLLTAIALAGVTLASSGAGAQSDQPASDAPAASSSTTPSSTTPTSTSSSSSSTASSSTSGSSASSTPTSSPPTRSTTATSSTTSSSHGAAPVTAPEEEEEDDGRDVDFIWIEVEGGVSYVNLVAFRNANFAGGDTDVFHEVTGTGPMVGAAVGFRVYWLAVGARMSFASYDAFQIGTVGADVQLRFPIPIIEPYIRVGAGYAWQGDANYTNPSMSTTTVNGWSFDAGLGFDIFLTNWLTLGAGAALDVLNMTRQSDPTQPCMGVTDFCPMMNGDSVGFQVRGFAQLGLHF